MSSPQEVQNLINKYRGTPQLFDDTQLDELEKLAKEYKITFNPKRNNTSLGKIMKQVTSGLFEGFTTIPVGDKPKNTYESIAHSMGHLVGFAPGILGGPITLASKGALKLGLKGTSEALKSAVKGTHVLNKMSVPMMGGNAASKIQNSIFRKSGLESINYLKRGGFARSVVDQAQHLGAASAVSSIWQGPDAWLDAYMGGAIAGGAFATLGEMKLINKQLISKDGKYAKKGEQRLKGVIGATMLGLPAYLRDEPIENVMYETLLGGYFGYGSRPSAEKAAGEFIVESGAYGEKRNAIFKPEDVKGWNGLHKKSQDYVLESSADQAFKYYKRNLEGLGYDVGQIEARILEKTQKKYRTENPTEQEFKNTVRELANDMYLGNTGYVYSDTEVYNNNVEPINQEDSTHQVELGSKTKKTTKLDESKARHKSKPVWIFHKNKNSDVVETQSHNDSVNGKKVGDKYIDRPVDYLEGKDEYAYLEKIAEHSELEIDAVGVKTVKSKNVEKDYNPFSYTLKKGKLESNMTEKDWWNLENNLDNQGMYVFGGIKDKGILTLRKLHKDSDISIKDLISSLVKNPNLNPKEQKALYERIQKSYLESLKDYEKIMHVEGADKKHYMKMHEKQYVSNILVEAERNGMYKTGVRNLDNINRIMNEGFSKNVIDWTKREQLYHDKSMPISEAVFGKGTKLKFGIAKEQLTEKYLDSEGTEKFFESNTDGTIVLAENAFNKIMKEVGLPEGVGMNKPVILAKIPNYGTIAIKSAARIGRNGSRIGKFMNDNQMDMMIFDSSSKHQGDIKSFDLKYDAKTKEYRVGGGNKNLRLLELDPKDIRINLSTYENPSSVTKGMNIPRQMIGNLSFIKHGDAAKIMWKEHYETAINGDIETNDKMYLFFLNKKDVDIKDIKVDDIGVENIIKLFKEAPDSKLAKNLSRQIARMDKEGELESYTDFNKSEFEDLVFRNNRILDSSNFNEGSKTSWMLGRKYWQDTYKKYMINRYIRPKYKQSSKAWLAPVFAHERTDIKEGTFKLDKGQGKMNVIGKDGKKTTLEKAYKDNNLDFDSFLLIRVPADSPSGVRNLKFAGFTKNKGMSIKTHAKDDMYLGGADKDSDSVFIFQGMNKKVIKAFKSSSKQWESNGRMNEAKDKKYDKDFGSEKDVRYENPESKFSPSFRRNVAKGIYRGQRNLGPGLIAKQALSNLADVITNAMLPNKLVATANKLPFIMSDKYGNKKELFIEVGNPRALDAYGREIVNRSADAADNPNMINFLQMPELLWKKAKFKVTDASGKEVSMNYANFKKYSSLGRLHNIYTVMNPKSQTEGRNKNLSEWTRDVENNIIDKETGEVMVEEHGVENLFNLAAKKMHDTKFLEQEVDSFYKFQGMGALLAKRIRANAKPSNPSEANFIKKELSKITNIGAFGENYNLQLQALLKSNLKPTTYINTKGKKRNINIEKFNEFIDKNIFEISAYNALSKKALSIYKDLKLRGIENPDKIMEEILIPLQEAVNDIKARRETLFNKNTDVDLKRSIDKEFDLEIIQHKEVGWKRKDSDVPSLYAIEKANGLRQGILSEYFDLYMLSPFGKGRFPSYKDGKASKWASKSIGNRAIKEIASEYNDLYKSLKDSLEGDVYVEDIPLVSQTKKIVDSIKPVEDYVLLINPNNKVNHITKDVLKNTKVNKETKSSETLEQTLNRKAVTDLDVIELETFKRNLKDNPKLLENFNDFFTMFTMGADRTMAPRDITTMDINDVYNLNRYLKDYDRRYKKRGTSLKPIHWYNDPRTISEHHAIIEGKVFSSYEMPVITSDGIVKRKVKMFTSTQGELQDTFATLRRHVDKNIAKIQVKNLDKYSFRGQTTPKDANVLQDMIIDVVQGMDYKLNSNYIKYKNKTFKINKKTMTTDEVIEHYAEVTKKDLKDFGMEYIYATNKSGERIDFSKIDKDIKFGTYNKYLKWDKNGRFDFKHYLNNAFPNSLTMSKVPIENSYRYHYEMVIEKIITGEGLIGKAAQKRRLSLREGRYSSFQKYEIGQRELYFPHLSFGATKKARAEIDAWLNLKLEKVFSIEMSKKGVTEKQALKEVALYKAEMELFIENSSSTSGLGEKAALDAMMHKTTDAKELNNIGVFSRPESLEKRTGDMPGWDRSVNALDTYKQRIVNSAYKSVAVSKTQMLLDAFKKDNNFGENTEAWGDFLSIYVRDAFGHKSTFPQHIQEAMERGLDPIAAKNTLYRAYSDTQAIKAYSYLQKKLGKWMPFSKKVPNNPYDSVKEPQKWQQAEIARNEAISKVVHMLGAQEAKFSLITLLSTPKVMVGNLFGASQMTFNQSGFTPYRQAMDFKHVEKTLLKNQKGEWVVSRTDSRGNKKFVKTKKDLKKWLVEEGVIDSYIQGELQYNMKFQAAIKQKGKAGKQFVAELTKLLKTNPDARPLTIIELAKKYNIDKKVLNASGFFMQISERKARYDAFLSSAIKFRNSYGRHGAELNLSDPAIVQAGLKGIEVTQFLYHSAFRAPFMRTATGKVMTRFKHYVFQSVRARKEFYRQAKHYGFKEGSEPYEKFKRMFVTDMMTTALGVLFAYSLFDTSTPPPYDFLASFSNLVFGDKQERDKAFFGTLPRPIAPLQYGLPPVTRIPLNIITPLINDDWDKFWDYNVHTMYPFGRMIRSIDKTVNAKYGTTFGRFTQQFTGLPLDKVKGKLDRRSVLKERKRLIDENLNTSYNE